MLRAACLAFLAAGCSAGAPLGHVEQAIIAGDLDQSDPAVMLIQAHVPGAAEAHICSGALVSPHVIVTAAHCVDPDTVGQGATFLVFDGTTAGAGAPPSQFLAVQETHYDTQFNPDKSVFPTAGHDIAVVILKSAPPITPLRYNHAPVSPSLVGQPARLVGYGVTSGSDSNATSAGTRRQAPTKLAGVNAVLLTFKDGTHDICEGDSGGPAFMTIAGVDTIAGITAFGEASCSPSTAGSDTRLDTWAPFVDGYVLQFDPPARRALATGAACAGDLECASKICAQIGGTSFCAADCDPATAGSCPAGMVCASLDEDDLCAPASLAMQAHTGCDLTPHQSVYSWRDRSAAWPGVLLWLGALALLGARRLRRAAADAR